MSSRQKFDVLPKWAQELVVYLKRMAENLPEDDCELVVKVRDGGVFQVFMTESFMRGKGTEMQFPKD
ncbi:MAG: hypothetical protein WC822_06110 [Candidatus Paceibacterota bacterium]